MSLSPGTRLGPYEILSPLGAGGMGEVYRARDTRLGREVAVKVLPPGLTDSEQARQRFEREARTISQLSHPHICALYDVGREGSTEYLVMELLEGQTLADRLAKGPLPLDQSLRLGAEIGDALENAHRQGIVHRDLKPGNIMVTSSGAKVLDFGLARALGPSDAVVSATGLPTETPLTEAGMVLGTVQYMAPEQLEGKEADARTDIFALGLVLYEMTTGRQAFSGATRASLIGSILRDEPAPISREQPLSPRALDRVVATCLAKEPEERWQTARDVALQLEGIRQERSAPEAATPAPGTRRGPSAALPWIVAAAGLALAVFGLTRGHRNAAAPRTMITVILPPAKTTFHVVGANIGSVAVSPDGLRLAFGARDAESPPRLWIREFKDREPYPLPGGEGALFPFWSPDSRSIGFFAQGKLKVVEVSNSPPPARVLADVTEGRGATWGADGTILYASENSTGLMRVNASGGAPTVVTRLDRAAGEVSHRWPQFLPGGRRFLYGIRIPDPKSRQVSNAVFVGSLDGPEKRQVLAEATSALFGPPDRLLFRRASDLLAVAFDPKSAVVTGEPVAIVRDIQAFGAAGASVYSVSETLLVYSPKVEVPPSRLVWLDRSGRELSTVGPPGQFLQMALSSDGRSAAVTEFAAPLPPDLWLYDTGVGRGLRLTRDSVPQVSPIFASDGQRIFFSEFPDGPWDLWQIPAHGGEAKVFLHSDSSKTANDVSPDGRFLLYREFNPSTRGDLKFVETSGTSPPRTFVASKDDETNGDFSPDGRWVAYASDESGRKEIYVASFPEPTRRFRVSSQGGTQPRWARNGNELFYIQSGQLWSAAVGRSGDDLTFGDSHPLFRLSLFSTFDPGFDVVSRYDVAADGRFFALLRGGDDAPTPLVVVLNWAEELRKGP